MRSRFLLRPLAWAWLAVIANAQAQDGAPPAPPATAPAYTPATGDAWVDARLADINAYAQRYPDSFLDELARYAGVRRGYAQALLEQQHWQPGDVYFACSWTFAMNLPCGVAVRAWSDGHEGGWQAVVKRLPIAPDNLHYRAVRHAIVASYDRWDRPVTLDATLARQLGDREQRRQRALAAAQAALAADQARLK